MSEQAGTIKADYHRDGFAFPIDVVSATEAQQLRSDLETAEKQLQDQPDKLALLRSYPDRLLPSFDQLIRRPSLLAPVRQILGDDLMVWSAGLFTKEPNTPHIVSWHQDLTYWGLDDAEELTAWVALSAATLASGCMRFVPGSHKVKQVPHVDSFNPNNLLSRGQEVAVEVDDRDGVDIILHPGQASLHHGHLFHASGPNQTADRRIGVAIRYIRPSMKHVSGDTALVALVSGADHFRHFTIAAPPQAALRDADFAHCQQDSEIKRKILYAGAQEAAGKRY